MFTIADIDIYSLATSDSFNATTMQPVVTVAVDEAVSDGRIGDIDVDSLGAVQVHRPAIGIFGSSTT